MHEPTVITAAFRPLQWAGSMRLTQVLLAMLAVATFAAYLADGVGTLTLGVPLALLTLNLVAAVVANASFRRQPALLMFHLSLIAIVLLLALSRLTAVTGRFELTEGSAFDGRLLASSRGWLASPRVDASFVHSGFTVEYASGLKRGRTANDVLWIDEAGVERRRTIGDQTPLTVNGYRFYTTSNKGFAPVFDWVAEGAAPVRGAVHLPSFPLNAEEQFRDWQAGPGEPPIRIALLLHDEVVSPDRPGTLRLPVRHSVTVRAGDVHEELRPGQSVALPGGTLHYVGLRSWMGYKVSYDPMAPWLLAASLVGLLTLVAHYLIKFRRHPW